MATKIEKKFRHFERNPQNSAVGSSTKPVYRRDFDAQGHLIHVKVGDDQSYEKIQSYEQSTNIYSILARFQETKDPNVLYQSFKTYADISGTPDNINDAVRLVMRTEEDFKRMPKSVKEYFHNNYREFLAVVGTEDFAVAYQNVIDDKVDTIMSGQKLPDDSGVVPVAKDVVKEVLVSE